MFSHSFQQSYIQQLKIINLQIMQTYPSACKGVILNPPALIRKFQSKRVLSYLSTNNRLIILTQSKFFVLNPHDQLFYSFLSVSAENIVRWAVNQHNEICILYADGTLEIRMLDNLGQIVHLWKNVQFKVGRGFPKIYWQHQEILMLNQTKIQIFNLKKKERKVYTDFVSQYESKSLLGLVESGLIDDERVIVMHFTNKLCFNIVPIPITQLSISNITGFLSLASSKVNNFLTPQYLVLVLDNYILRVYNLINMKPLLQIQYEKVQDERIELTSDWKKEYLIVMKLNQKNKITRNVMYKVNVDEFYCGKNIREGSRFFQYEVEIEVKENLMIFPLSSKQEDGPIKIIDFAHIRHYAKRDKGKGEVLLSRIAINEDFRRKNGIRGCKIDFPGFPQLRQWKEIIESYIEMKNLFSQGKRAKNIEKQKEVVKVESQGTVKREKTEIVGQKNIQKQREQKKQRQKQNQLLKEAEKEKFAQKQRQRQNQRQRQRQRLKQKQKQRQKQKQKQKKREEMEKLKDIAKKKKQKQTQIQKEAENYEKLIKRKPDTKTLQTNFYASTKQKENDTFQLQKKYERLKNCIIQGALKYQLQKQKNSPTGEYQYEQKQFYAYMKEYLKNEDFESDAQLLFANFKINQNERVQNGSNNLLNLNEDEEENLKYLSDQVHGHRQTNQQENTKLYEKLLLNQTKSAQHKNIDRIEQVRERSLSENKLENRSVLMTNTDLNTDRDDQQGYELDIMTRKISEAICQAFKPIQEKLQKISQQLNRIQTVNVSQLKRCERVLKRQEKQMQNLDLTIKGFVRELLSQFEEKLQRGLQSYWKKIQELDHKSRKQTNKTMESFSNFIDRQIKSRQDVFDQSRSSIQNHLVHLRKKMTNLFQRSFYPDEQDDYYNQVSNDIEQRSSDQGY